jgi:hypothetical protein
MKIEQKYGNGKCFQITRLEFYILHEIALRKNGALKKLLPLVLHPAIFYKSGKIMPLQTRFSTRYCQESTVEN